MFSPQLFLLAAILAQEPQPPDFGTPNSPFVANTGFLKQVDLDGDGTAEFIGYDGTIYIMNGASVIETRSIFDSWDQLHPQRSFDNMDWHKFADIDGDGLIDIFLPSMFESSPSRLAINQGDMKFEEVPTPAEWSHFDRGGVVIDVDQDGDLDFLHILDNHLQWTENLGNRSFRFMGALAPQAIPEDLTISDPIDLDGDGRMDLVAWGGAELAFFFKPSKIVQITLVDNDKYSTCAAWSDVDQNGLLDIVFGYSNDKDKLFLQQANLSFLEDSISLSTLNKITQSLAFFDIDGDLDQDLFIGHRYKDQVYENIGMGVFQSKATSLSMVSSPTEAVLSVDLDHDGDFDLMRGADGLTMTRSWNLENGEFSNRDHGLPTQRGRPRDAVFGDWDSDGDLDVWIIHRAGGSCKIWRNDGVGNFAEEDFELNSLSNTPIKALRIDWNQDGMHDLIFTDDFDDLNLRIQGPPGIFTDSTSLLPMQGARIQNFFITDLDNDGDEDFYLYDTTNSQQEEIRFWENRGLGSWDASALPIQISNANSYLSFGDVDINGDQLPEIIHSTRYPTPGIEVWENNGGFQFQQSSQLLQSSPGQEGRSFQAGDLDGDGWQDLAFITLNQDPQPWTVGVFWNENGKLIQSKVNHFPTILDNAVAQWSTWSITIADFNMDGLNDLLLGSDYSSLSNRIMLNYGSRIFGFDRNPRKYVETQTRTIATADVDGDGDVDLFIGDGSAQIMSNRTYHLGHLTPAVPGRMVDLDIRGPEGTPWTLIVGLQQAQIEIPGIGTLRINPNSILGTKDGLTNSEHQSRLQLAIPMNAAIGRTLYTQCWYHGAAPRLGNLDSMLIHQ
jgi:hypothetical protein